MVRWAVTEPTEPSRKPSDIVFTQSTLDDFETSLRDAANRLGLV
jgi:hypothetical protein